jgi:hypothetical protein
MGNPGFRFVVQSSRRVPRNEDEAGTALANIATNIFENILINFLLQSICMPYNTKKILMNHK